MDVMSGFLNHCPVFLFRKSRSQLFFELAFDSLHILLPAGFEQQANGCASHRTGKRITHESGTVHESSRCMIGNGVCHPIACQDCGKCHISAGQRFTDTHNIGLYSGVFPSKKFAGTSESCRYLIENQKKAMLPAEFSRFTQVLRMVEPHTACPLHDRFKNQCRQLSGMFFNGFP